MKKKKKVKLNPRKESNLPQGTPSHSAKTRKQISSDYQDEKGENITSDNMLILGTQSMMAQAIWYP